MSNKSDHPDQTTIDNLKHEQSIQDLQEEIDKLKRTLDKFCIRKKDRINYLPTGTIQKYAEQIKSLNDLIISLTSRQKYSKWGAPMGATGDKGIPYTYPAGNSEDY